METKKQIEEWKHRRSLRIREKRKAMAQYNRDKRNDADGEGEEREGRKGKNGNTHLPYGLCKKNGIDLPAGATPYDAWQALKGKGIAPPWEEGKEAEKAQEQLPQYEETKPSTTNEATSETNKTQNTKNPQDVISDATATEEDITKTLNELPDNTLLEHDGIKLAKVNGEWKKIFPSGNEKYTTVDMVANKVLMKSGAGKPYTIQENGYTPKDYEGIQKAVQLGGMVDVMEELDKLEANYHIAVGDEEWVKMGDNWKSLSDGTVMNNKAFASELLGASAVGIKAKFLSVQEEPKNEAEQQKEGTKIVHVGFEDGDYAPFATDLEGYEIGTQIKTSDAFGNEIILTKLDFNEWSQKGGIADGQTKNNVAVYNLVAGEDIEVTENPKGNSTENLTAKTEESPIDSMYASLKKGDKLKTAYALIDMADGTHITTPVHEYAKYDNKWFDETGKYVGEGDVCDDMATATAKYVSVVPPTEAEQPKQEEVAKPSAKPKKKMMKSSNYGAMNVFLEASGDIGTEGYNKALDVVLDDMNVGDTITAATFFGKEIFKKTESGFANGISGKSVTADTIKEKMGKATGKAKVTEGENANNYSSETLKNKKVMEGLTSNVYKSQNKAAIETSLKQSFGLIDDGEEIFANGYHWKKSGNDGFENMETGEYMTSQELAKSTAKNMGYVKFDNAKFNENAKGNSSKAGLIKIGKFKENPFTKDAYSEKRKNNAVWGTTTEKKLDIHSKSLAAVKLWIDKVGEKGKSLLFKYTAGSGNINGTLRAGDGSSDGVHFPSDSSYQDAMELKKAIGQSHLAEDTWLQRGVKVGVFLYNFGISDKEYNAAKNSSNPEEAFQNLLVGKDGHDAAFMSAGTGKASGFDNERIIYNIYCPKGTSAVYAEPISDYSKMKSGGKYWSGEYELPYDTNGEMETLINAGTSFRCTKVSYDGWKLYVDVEVTGQDNPDEAPTYPHVNKTTKK